MVGLLLVAPEEGARAITPVLVLTALLVEAEPVSEPQPAIAPRITTIPAIDADRNLESALDI
jgi:hypothetical protein